MIQASLRRLSVFKTVFDLGGINAAAARLDIAQPSVSAHIQGLEKQLGTTLFVRQRGQRLRPTDSGKAFYRYACDALGKSREVQLELRRLDGKTVDGFVLGLQRSFANYILPNHLAAFLQTHPNTQVSVHSETQEGLVELLRAGNADVGIMFASAEVSGFTSEIIGHEQLVVIAAPQHPLAKKQAIPPQELRSHPFVGALHTSQFFKLVEAALRDIGVEGQRVVLQVQDTVSVKEAVACNIGIACTLRSAVEAEMARGEMVALDIAAKPMSLPVQCLYRQGDQLPKAAKQFLQHLKAKGFLISQRGAARRKKQS
jgi:DNA-binding transcriptional LysR family regulator